MDVTDITPNTDYRSRIVRADGKTVVARVTAVVKGARPTVFYTINGCRMNAPALTFSTCYEAVS